MDDKGERMTEIIVMNDATELAEHLLDHANTISASWRSAAASIIETGRLINIAEQELLPAEYRQLREYLATNSGLSQTVISKLKTISRNPLLLDPNYQSQLPPSYATLYHISKIENKKLKQALENGVINADTQLKDIKSRFNTVKNPRKKKSEEDEAKIKIEISGSLDEDTMSDLKEFCESLSKKVKLIRLGFPK